jgi:predicted transcriptional regulator
VLTPKQLRAARVLLGWSRAKLAAESSVPLPTLDKIESGKTDPKLTTAGKLRRTLEDAGVIFVDPTAEHGPGIILREGKRPPKKG